MALLSQLRVDLVRELDDDLICRVDHRRRLGVLDLRQVCRSRLERMLEVERHHQLRRAAEGAETALGFRVAVSLSAVVGWPFSSILSVT